MRAAEFMETSSSTAAAATRAQVDAARTKKADAAKRYQDALRRANDTSTAQQAKKAVAARRYQDQMHAAGDAERNALSKQ